MSPTPEYRRILEELTAYLAPDVAQEVLDAALERSGVFPAQQALSFDIRAILVETLPDRLAEHLRQSDVTPALAGLEEALVQIHRPAALLN